MIIVRIFLICSLLLFSFITSVNACSCAEPLSVEESLEQAAAVFSGKVIRVKEKKQEHGFYGKSVLFEVNEIWKGVEHSQIMIETGSGDADCGIHFKEGVEYLVYAYEDESKLKTYLCTRTKELSFAQDDLFVLGEGSLPVSDVDTATEQKSFLHYIPIIFVIILGLLIGIMNKKRK